MENCEEKNFFMIKLSLPLEWHDTYHEKLHYKSFSFPPFSTDYQTGRKGYFIRGVV